MRVRAAHARPLLAVLALLLFAPAPSARAQDAPAYVPGEVLVRFRPGASAARVRSLQGAVGGDVLHHFPKIGVDRLKVSTGTVEQAIAVLKADPDVVFAEPNYILHAQVTPNDPLFPQLWGLQNTGQTGGTPGADIHATQAWTTFTGSASVLVGVIDTGVDYTHPDLAPNIWTNPGEIPGNGIDDDHNGFVDDFRGWDFANNDNDPMDDHYHGTHVSGTIGGVGDNGQGVVGVNWHVSILPIKFLDAGGSGTTDAAIQSIDYAALMGVRVINASWGGGGYSEALKLSIAAAGDAGVLFVASAGNNASNNDIFPSYPSSYDLDNIVAVAATDANDQLAYFSNYGIQSVDLGAPGVDVLSCAPGNGYQYLSGTSMAAPHVTGVAALIRGRFPNADPAMTKALLLNRAQPVPGLAGRVLTGARLDALGSISDPDTIPPGDVSDLATGDPQGQRVTLHWTATGDDGTTGIAFAYDVRYSTSPIDASNFDAATPAPNPPAPSVSGTPETMVVRGLTFSTGYHFALRVRDEFGNASAVSNDAQATTSGPPDIAVSPDSLHEALLTGQTSTQLLTIDNTGVSELTFSVRREAVNAAPSIVDLVTAPGGVPDRVLATGSLVDAAALRRLPAEREVLPGDFGSPDGRGVMRPQAAGPGMRITGHNEETFGSTLNAFFGGPRVRGNLFHCTTPRVLKEHRFYLSVSYPTQLWFLVYEGTAPTGTYSLVSATQIPSAPLGQGWYSSGPVNVPMIEGRYYMVVASFDQAEGYYNQTGITPYPIPASFGELTAGVGWFWAPTPVFPPPPAQDVPPDVYGDAVAYYQTIVSDDAVTWVSAAPETGAVPAGGHLDLAVKFDATGMNDGDYDARILIDSNDPDEPTLPVAAHLHVTGAPDIAVTPPTLDFGSPFIGAVVVDSFQVKNIGTATLNVTGITVTPSAYSVDPGGFSLAPGAARKLAARFAPTFAGPQPGQITVDSNDPDLATVTVPLAGTGVVAPVIAVAPDSLSADLLSGQQATRTLTVSNSGGSDLTFSVGFASVPGDSVPNALVRIVPLPPEPGKGFAAPPSDRAPAGYHALAAKRVTNAGAHVLLIEDVLPWGSSALQTVLGANGIAYDQIGGAQIASTNLRSYHVVIVASDQYQSTYNAIAAGAAQFEDFVLHGGQLEFHAAGWGWNGGDPSLITLPGGMQIVQYYSGTNHVLAPGHPIMAGVPEPFYGSSASHAYFAGVPAGAELLAADDLFRPNLVRYHHGAGTVTASGQTLEFGYVNAQPAGLILANMIPFVSGGGVEWLTASPLDGTVPPGQSLAIQVTFDATDLLGGTYLGQVQIASNDPVRPEVDVPATLHVTGVPNVAVRGHARTYESSADYFTTGASTHHSFVLPAVPGTDGVMHLTTIGDFADVGETATLVVEGLTLGQLGQRGYDCYPDSGQFSISNADLALVGADRRVDVTVVNSPLVDPTCAPNRHTVRFSYREAGDRMDLGVRLLTTCHSETLEVANTGTDGLVIGGVDVSPPFSASLGALALAPHTSTTLVVTFCPTAVGPAATTLVLHSNDPDTPDAAVALTGTGAIPPDIAVTPPAFEVQLDAGQSDSRTLTIANSGGPLVWTADVDAGQESTLVQVTPVVTGTARPKEETRFEPRPFSLSRSSSGPVAASPAPVPAPPSGGSLEEVLTALDGNYGLVTSAIPNRYDFQEGFAGYSITDGGGDMYDGGNYLFTDLGGYIAYSDGVIQTSYAVGPQGRYFTRKYPGLFVFVADLDGASQFGIDGNLGADGGGSVDGAVIDIVHGTPYRLFIKRVFNAFDPSVNHLLIVPNGGGVSQSFPAYTDADTHVLSGLSERRIYDLLYAGQNGGYIDNASAVAIARAFLDAIPASGGAVSVAPTQGGAPGGGSVDVTVNFDARNLIGGDYARRIVIHSNDPDENPVVVPALLHVHGTPDIAASPDSLEFPPLFVGLSEFDSLLVSNVGTDVLHVSGVLATPAEFAVFPESSFALAPGESHAFVARFRPTAPGEVFGAITFTSDDPDESTFSVPLHGTGLVPPVAVVSPDSLSADLRTNQTETQTLTVSNQGGSPLVFELLFAPGANSPAPLPALRPAPRDAGDAPPSDRAPGDYSPQSAGPRGTSGARVLLVLDYFPWGSAANQQVLEANAIPYDLIGSGQLAATNLHAYRTVIVASDQPQFSYQNLAARAAQLADFVQLGGSLEFHAAGWGWNGGDPSILTLPGGMHIVQYYSGTNHVLAPAHPIMAGVPEPFFGSSASHAYFTSIPAGAELLASDDQNRPDLVRYHFGAGSVTAAGQTLEYGYSHAQTPGLILANMIPFVAGNAVEWLSTNVDGGIVAPGQSLPVVVKFDATAMLGGDYRARIQVASNDPVRPLIEAPVHLHVVGAPDLAVSPDSIVFAPLFVGATGTDSLTVRNTGTDVLHVTGVAIAPALFTVPPGSFDLAPGTARALPVSFTPAAPGPVQGAITLTSNDPDTPTLLVPLHGFGLTPPTLAIAPDSLGVSLPSGGMGTRTLTVSNTGGSQLSFTISLASLANANGPPPVASSRIAGGQPTPSDRAPDGYVPQAGERVQTPGARVLLVQDMLPWGSPSNQALLSINSIAYDQVPSSQLGAVNLGAYKVVIVAGDQTSQTYLNIAARAADLDSFVVNGGRLEFHAAGFGYNGGDPTVVTLPGGVHIEADFSALNHVLLPGHPIASGVPEPMIGGSVSHVRFTSIPAGADLILADDQFRPNLILYHRGLGYVVAAGQTLEYGWQYGEPAGIVLQNMIPYVAGAPIWLSVAPANGYIAPGQHQDVLVTFNAFGLAGGFYPALMEIASNDPAHALVDVPVTLSVTGLNAVAVPDAPLQFGLAKVSPTPAVGAAQIAFTLTRPGPARVAIYDVAGRKVKTLAQGAQPAGRQSLTWRGDDDRGARRGAGVYLLRLDAEEGQRTERVVWVP